MKVILPLEINSAINLEKSIYIQILFEKSDVSVEIWIVRLLLQSTILLPKIVPGGIQLHDGSHVFVMGGQTLNIFSKSLQQVIVMDHCY